MKSLQELAVIAGVMVSEARERAGIIKTALVVAQAIQTLQQ